MTKATATTTTTTTAATGTARASTPARYRADAVHPAAAHDPAQRLLEAIAGGAGMPDGLFAAGAVLDATVPMWRYETTGDTAIRLELAKWYGSPTRIEHVRRRPFPGGEAIEIDISWTENGIPHAGHQIHVLTLSNGLIASDTVFCGGRWPAELLAEMEAARAT